MASIQRIDRTRAQLVVVDLQEKLLPHIARHGDVVSHNVRICQAARVLDLPITVTEQYRKGLGQTPAEVLTAADGATLLEKMTFSVWQDEPMRERILSLGRPQVLLTGIESHVCVQQTALDLLAADLEPFLLADAVGSRHDSDRQHAIERMRAAGAVVTTVEAAIFEMLDRAGTDLFKRILPIVR